MLATTKERVPQNTAEDINERIRHQTERSIYRAAVGGRAAIDRRLAELDEEWDIERCLETMASSFTLVGLTLGLTKKRVLLLLPAVVQSFFLQHALQGWCPPLPLLRRFGIRTADEINQERYALKALRGDFKMLCSGWAVDSTHRRSVDAMHAVQS
jgi:hypothetical protein